MRAFLRYLSTAIMLSIAVLVAACADSTITVVGGITTTPGVTATIQPTCASALPGATTASAGPNFTDLTFPANTVSTALVLHTSGTGLYAISTFNACTTGMTAAQVKSFYASGLPAGGWPTAAKLPFDGSYFKACGDPYCWQNGDYLHRRLIGLESVADHPGNFATFTWRLFVPPAPGVCNAADFTGGAGGGVVDGGPLTMQFPPLTYSLNTDNGAGNHYYVLCSAGNPTTILAFLKKAAPLGGWTITGSTATTLAIRQPTSPPSGFCYTADITVGGHAGYPGEWDMDSHPPAVSC